MMPLPFVFAPTSSPPTNFALSYLYNEGRCNEYFDNLKVKNEKKRRINEMVSRRHFAASSGSYIPVFSRNGSRKKTWAKQKQQNTEFYTFVRA